MMHPNDFFRQRTVSTEVEETYRLHLDGCDALSIWSSYDGKIAVRQSGVQEPIYIDKEFVPALCKILTQLQED